MLGDSFPSHDSLLSKLAKLLITLGDIHPLQESTVHFSDICWKQNSFLRWALKPSRGVRCLMPQIQMCLFPDLSSFSSMISLFLNLLECFLIPCSVIRPSIPIFPIFVFSFTFLDWLSSLSPANSCFQVPLFSSSGDTSLHSQSNQSVPNPNSNQSQIFYFSCPLSSSQDAHPNLLIPKPQAVILLRCFYQIVFSKLACLHFVFTVQKKRWRLLQVSFLLQHPPQKIQHREVSKNRKLQLKKRLNLIKL